MLNNVHSGLQHLQLNSRFSIKSIQCQEDVVESIVSFRTCVNDCLEDFKVRPKAHAYRDLVACG
jgi:hypothetical protein